jgi:archaetidylinositol phosphate synthase
MTELADMSQPDFLSAPSAIANWDARLAHRLVAPLRDTWVTPNHLTTVRLAVGLLGAAAFLPGTYGWANIAALLVVVSNFLDHADGELARLGGKSSRLGHLYDLASDALVTILTFIAIGVGVGERATIVPPLAAAGLGLIAGSAIALIFYLRMRIEDRLGKAGTSQASFGGFETEDVLYLLPLVTLCDAAAPVLIAASVCAPLFALWVAADYRRVMHRQELLTVQSDSG